MHDRHHSILRAIAAVSGSYDVLAGVLMIFGRPLLSALFASPPPTPVIHADLNGLFLLAVGAGYWLPWRDPERYRGYLWVMGPGLKGAGAVLFILDHFLRGSPASYLVFALTDGTLALATLWALIALPLPTARRALPPG
jgi:hypothetical protein